MTKDNRRVKPVLNVDGWNQDALLFVANATTNIVHVQKFLFLLDAWSNFDSSNVKMCGSIRLTLL